MSISDYVAVIEKAQRERDAVIEERNRCRDIVQALTRALTKTVRFYDKIEAPHHPGEAALLDELTAVLYAVSASERTSKSVGCGDSNCKDPDCSYGK